MRKFRKYEFGSKSAATTKIKALGVDEEGHPSHAHSSLISILQKKKSNARTRHIYST
jgi:hypothetical protein